MEHLPQRVALVYDWVNKWGGAERVLLALHEIFPTAPLYTAVYQPHSAAWAKVFPQVIPSFLNSLPLSKSHHELYPWLTPLAFDSFTFNQYDAVISVTSADAKGLLTQPSTFHLCYCLTPTRYLWSHHQDYQHRLPGFIKPLAQPVYSYLKYWDQVAARRPDAYVSISQTVQRRLLDFYAVPSDVVYPPVDMADFSTPLPAPQFSDYFLYVGRLVSYKHPERVIQAFNHTHHRLVVVGSGECERSLRRQASKNISFTGLVNQKTLISLYQHARGLVFFHEEDFGLVPVEAMASGTPVIAVNRGGVAESVLDQITGLLLPSDSLSDLVQALDNFSPQKFDRQAIINRASSFSTTHFNEEFVKVFTRQWKKYSDIYMS